MLERFATVEGNRIRYLEEGNSGDTVVLLHGLGGMAERWSSVIPLFSKNYRVIAPDMIGYGRSDKPQTDYTPEFFKRMTLGLLDVVSPSGAYMVGTSLGGEIVAECASTKNHRIKKVVMVAPAGIMKKSTPALDAYTVAALYPTHESVRLAYSMMMGGDKKSSDVAVENFISSMTRPNAKMVFISTLLGMKNSPPIKEKLGLINVPVLLIWGTQDRMIPVSFAKEFESSIPNCNLVLMEGCGHIPYDERPEEFSRYVLDFLSGNKPK